VSRRRNRGSGRRRKGFRPKSLYERFLAKTEKLACESGCWIWLGTLSRGYGNIRAGSNYSGTRSKVLAHRLSFFFAHGHWPEPMGMHTCDVKVCVNPAHIKEGDATTNAADALVKGRPMGCKAKMARSR